MSEGIERSLRLAYADPPYLGLCSLYDHDHPDGRCWDEPDTHRRLIERLSDEFDGWALSLHTPSLRTMLNLCPDDVRVCAWVKPFAHFKLNVRFAYAWEPVIVRGGRKRQETTVRDWVSANIVMKGGFKGAKPAALCRWMFEVLGAQPGDEFVDLFHGSGAVARTWAKWQAEQRFVASDVPVFDFEDAS